MVEFLQFFLLICVIALSLLNIRTSGVSALGLLVKGVARSQTRILLIITCFTFFGCWTVAGLLHEPVPRLHDEFSYALMGDTFASGRASNPSPALPEFFETFHVLVRPTYASKYFPAQGIFLAIGEKLTGHPAVGLWLSSTLACVGASWMLRVWVGPIWGFVGGLLMAIQIGVYSYWSQSYWGGMAAALGGSLFFGAIRRLWERFSWQSAVWLAIGLVILANSRPLEGLLAILPSVGLLLWRTWEGKQLKRSTFWLSLVLPAGMVLVAGVLAMGEYNKHITGSAWRSPYLLHEQQYQESPPLVFLGMRPKINYSNPILAAYYEGRENGSYNQHRHPATLAYIIARKLATWWAFYCGILLTAPLVLPALLRRDRIRTCQAVLLASLILLVLLSDPKSIVLHAIIAVLALLQIGLLWKVFDDLWSRLSIVSGTALLLLAFVSKWSFPHYFAPAACLILFLQIQGLRFLWHWRDEPSSVIARNRKERRRIEKEKAKTATVAGYSWRAFVTLLPLACLISLGFRIAARAYGWGEDPHGPDRSALLSNDWSLRRAELDHWLEQQPGPQLVFVRYSPRHNVNFEWVYNHADLTHSHVIWARDLGPEHNRLLLRELPDRVVWSLEADSVNRQLAPYSQANLPTTPSQSAIPVSSENDALSW